MEWSQYSIKILGDNFRNSILDNPNWDKISEELIKKKKHLEQSEPLIQIVVHR